MDNRRLASSLAFLVAAFAIAVGVTHFLMPREQLHLATGASNAFYASLAANSGPFRVHYWSFVVAALANLGLVIAVRSLISEPRSLLYRLTETIAIVGLSVTAIDFALMQSKALSLVDRLPNLDASAQAAVIALGLPHLDPTGLFGFALPGAWLVVFSLEARRTRSITAAVAFLGLLAGLLYASVFLGSVAHLTLVIDLAAGLGGVVVFPVWAVCIGLVLHRSAAPRNH